MMIWHSTLLMAVIDAVMILGALKALQILFRHRAAILGMKIAPPVQAIVAGLCIISGLYLADLYTMLVMPLYASDEAAKAAMRNLHLNWSWLVVLSGFAAIVAGLAHLVAKLFPQIATIIKGLEAEVVERKQAEEALQEARDQLELRVEERTAEPKETNEQLMREIAERKYVGKALRESEATFRAFIDNFPGEIFVKDREGRYLLVDQEYNQRYGMTLGHAKGKTIADFFPQEVVDPNTAAFRQVIETGNVVAIEERLHYGGVDHTNLLVQFPIQDQAGNVIAVGGMGSDITERKRAEAALRESEASLANAQRIANLGNWDSNIVTGDLHWSDEIYRIFGLRPQQFGATYEAFLQSVHPDDRKMVQDAADRALREMQPYSIDYRIVLPGGEERIVHEQDEFVFDKSGNPIRMNGTVQDVTERKRSEKALRESEARYHAVVEDQTEMISRHTPDGSRTFVNEAYCRFHGKSRDQLIGRSAYEALAPEDLDRLKALYARLTPEQPVGEFEVSFPGPDGETIWQHWTKRAVFDATGCVTEYQAVGRDITEQKRAEAEIHKLNEELEQRVEERTTELRRANRALGQSEERFRTMVEQAGDAMFLIEPDGSFIDVNQRACDALGYTRAELLTLSVPEIDPVFPKERFHELFEGLPLHAPVTVEAVHRRKDGTTYPVEIRTGRIELHGRKLLLSLARDISKRKRAEDALREAQDELLRRERLATLGQLTATVSHELRNPLGVIRTSAFILRDGLKEEMPRARRALERVERSVMRCDRIIDEMLDFTRISDLEPEPTALDDWLAGVLEEQPLPTGIVLRQELQLPETTVALDRDRFRRAVINVFDNACQAMRGESHAETQPAERVLTVRTRERAGRIEVVFEDRGPGIAPDVYERIFEPLYSTKGFGVGLGLPVVKQIMEQHGGGIEIETEEGRGTRVCLWLDRNARAEHVAA